MNEHNALKNLVAYWDDRLSVFMTTELRDLVNDGRKALDEAEEQKTIDEILTRVDNIATLVENDLEKIPKIVTESSGDIWLKGVDTNGNEVSVPLTRTEA